MRKLLMVSMLVLAALALAAVAFAEGGHGDKGKGTKPAPRQMSFGPYDYTSPDNGSCSNINGNGDVPWAADTMKRTWRVKRNDDGSFRVERRDRGTFVTTGPVSPGKCDNKGKHHGSVVVAGIAGRMHGYLKGTVTGGTFNANGCSAAGAVCTTVPGFISATFGPGASFTCANGYAGCKFDFEYSSPDKQLKYRRWADRGTDGVHEYFRGDIATA